MGKQRYITPSNSADVAAALRSTGVAPPQSVATAPATSNPWAGTAYDNGFLDLNTLQQLQQQYKAQGNNDPVLGADFLRALKPLSGVSIDPNDVTARQNAIGLNTAMGGHMEGSGENAQWVEGLSDVAKSQPIYHDAAGRSFQQTGTDANGNPLIKFFDNGGGGWENPTGSGHDRVQPIYALQKDGTATPVDPGTYHKDSAWVDWGRDLAKWAAVMATAGTAGAYLGGAGAAEGAAGGAAAGGAGAAEGATAAGGGLGAAEGAAAAGGGAGAGGAGAAGAAEGAAAGSAASYAPATNSVLADSAVNSAGYGASSAGAGLNAGAAVGGASPSLWDAVKSYAGDKLTNPGTYTDLLKAYYGGGSGGGNISLDGGGFRAPDRSARIQAEALRKKAMMEQQNFKPTMS